MDTVDGMRCTATFEDWAGHETNDIRNSDSSVSRRDTLSLTTRYVDLDSDPLPTGTSRKTSTLVSTFDL